MPSAVSNASPLIHLAAIGRFSLLRDFFDEVVIPPSVWHEVVDEGGGRPGTQAVQEGANTGWIRVEALSSDTLARFLRRDLDDGEADSIALAVEISPSVILLDESEARRLAELYSLKKTGVVGLFFELTGEKDAPLRDQLQNFTFAFRTTFPDEPISAVQSWRDAFQLLASTVDAQGGNSRVIIFLDELPWLASPRSRLLQALDHFWNSWANRKRNLLVVVCGSAASWMIGKILHSKGGLYNRVTAHIRLMPFTLAETERYLQSRQVHLGRKDILELTMSTGGPVSRVYA